MMRGLVVGLLFAVFMSGAYASGPVAGKFDFYVLSLSWEPAFCQAHQGTKECRQQTPDGFDANNLSLHGLWPDKRDDPSHRYGYCDVSKKVIRLDHERRWCDMPSEDLSQQTIKELGKYMPGYQSCLENHEWYKHGTCSKMGADRYFSTAAMFVANMPNTNLGKLISSKVGQDVAVDELNMAAKQDYGDKSDSVRYFCERGALQEVRFYLKKELPENGVISADALVTPEKNLSGLCTGQVHIDQVAGQQQ